MELEAGVVGLGIGPLGRGIDLLGLSALTAILRTMIASVHPQVTSPLALEITK